MLAKIYSGTVIGLDGVLIEVEVDVASRGFPTFTIVGLPSKAVDEAKDRVRTAIVNTNFAMPESRLTVNLAPADIPKNGSSFDLPIAVGILVASGFISVESVISSLFVGELSLQGQVRRVPGIISLAAMAKEKGITKLYLPLENAEEATLVRGIEIYPLRSLEELILHLNGVSPQIPLPEKIYDFSSAPAYEFDFSDVKGQAYAKRALLIAAAGFHNIHLKGPPGAGKTMLCRAFPSIMPPLEEQEMLEVSRIYSSVGLFTSFELLSMRPFRSPHHTTSRIGLIGGGTIPTPGEISLSHRGTLFLDELPEFPHTVLESLRQPLEDGQVTISRAASSFTFPCRFLLLAASNPCPCGYRGHPTKPCTCSPNHIEKYKKRISGPLLDRIDMHLSIVPVQEKDLSQDQVADSSKELQKRVIETQTIQRERFGNTSVRVNSQIRANDVKKYCPLSEEATSLLKQATEHFSLSARSYFKIIRVARTIADLEKRTIIELKDVAESLQYRTQEEL
ncbi:YifB family Mg chelatase-like AAA ATPase [Candidatus Roizmanbacteria bacterium]|nr:YifB family Mg chelatase-like AAA ATPase [Candidatus Roizmanbacteria bacterium]